MPPFQLQIYSLVNLSMRLTHIFYGREKVGFTSLSYCLANRIVQSHLALLLKSMRTVERSLLRVSLTMALQY
jgi:hypothetical protein